MTATMQPATVSRLTKLLPMLGSDKPGEVTGTAAAIGRVLQSAVLDWHDLATGLKAGTAQQFTFATMPPPAGAQAVGNHDLPRMHDAV